MFRRASVYDTVTAPAAVGAPPSTHQQQQQQGSIALLATPEGPTVKPMLLPGSCSQADGQQHVDCTQLCRAASEDSSAAVAAPTAACNDPDDLLVDVLQAKRAKVAGAAAAVDAAAVADQGADLMAAAEAGLLSGVKVVRQVGSSNSKQASRSEDQEQHPRLRDSSSAPPPPATDKNTQAEKRPHKMTAATVASKAWAFATAVLSARSSRSASLAQASAAALVPKPANPSELVAPPTADEQRRARSKKAAFPVEQILAHRVSGSDKSTAHEVHRLVFIPGIEWLLY